MAMKRSLMATNSPGISFRPVRVVLRRAGMTYIELIIYVALSAVVMAVAGSLFMLAKRSSENTNANYFLSSDTETAVAWLRRDLQQCCLATLQSSPQGISMASALDSKEVRRIDVNEDGHPNWRNHVYYTLQPRDKTVARLIRWNQATATEAPRLPTLAPGQPQAVVKASSRTIHTRVLMPNQELYGVGNPDGKIDAYGGLHLQFVRRSGPQAEDVLSDVNPAVASAQGNIQSDTRLVQVELKFFISTGTGKPSFYSLRFRVCPRY